MIHIDAWVCCCALRFLAGLAGMLSGQERVVWEKSVREHEIL